MTRRQIILSLSIVVILALIFQGGRYFVFAKIKSAALDGVGELQKRGFEINYGSFRSDFWNFRFTIDNIDVKFPRKTNTCAENPAGFTAGKMTVQGLEIFSLIFRKEVHLDNVAFSRPVIRYSRWGNHGKNSQASNKIKSLSIAHFQLDSVRLEKFDSAECVLDTRANFSAVATELDIKDPGDGSMTWFAAGATVSGLRLEFPKKFYTLTLRQLTYRRLEKLMQMDSLEIIPDYDKAEFAKKSKTQIDRIAGRVPLIRITGAEIPFTMDSPFLARQATLDFDLDIFRDKRYPFQEKHKSLPSRMLHDLALKIRIDTVEIEQSQVVYSEFPEEGNEPGSVSFHDLIGGFHNVSNIGGPITLHAQANFMNAGKLMADFTFPHNPNDPYTAKGTLTDFDMKKLNGAVIPMAHAEVKSGFLQSMAFHFEYNDYRSDGKLTMDYQHLEIVSLVKKSRERLPNRLATMILQAFVVKKDVDKKDPGTILFFRDQNRSIFNYWWKSILSGVKSIYNLDKVGRKVKSEK